MAADRPRALWPASMAMFVVGVVCMLLALGLSNVTLAGSSYRGVLLAALALTAAADACLAAAFRWGGWRWRIAAVAAMLPTCWILLDFLRRAPYL
jgi:hypothetical protein